MSETSGQHPEVIAQNQELASSFAVEFSTVKYKDVTEAMRNMGGFRFDGSSPSPDQTMITYTGSRTDGTKIEVSFTKGERYQSPAELAQTEAEADETEASSSE